jgi:hypothetical protein
MNRDIGRTLAKPSDIGGIISYLVPVRLFLDKGNMALQDVIFATLFITHLSRSVGNQVLIND